MNSDQIRALSTSRTYLNHWGALVDLQAERALEGGVTDLRSNLDAYQFAHVLNQLVRAADSVNRQHLGGSADAVIDAFCAAVPHWKDVRDVIEHFDDYDLGVGHLQQSGRLPKDLPYLGAFFALRGRATEREKTLFLGASLSLPIHTAREAAAELLEGTRLEISRLVHELEQGSEGRS